ncbi:ABC transporter permease [Jeotgalibaca ciconiae]|uniref:ABC transporter permease n=1 Tax=Jeotgalibaca ciconiae TaxID=2496265 RepID=A0A3Q9BJR3_9LACT|nr:ABC transporter permease [Jeotgalibaca ciconiae]AZP03894.1 ABC transporter permease [Jeotgalibaca ciconiae]
MNKFWIIVSQVYKKNVKSIGFVTMMLSPIVMIGIIAAIIYFVGNSFDQTPTIAVLTESEEVSQVLKAEEEYFTVDETIVTKEAAEETMEQEEIDGYLTVTSENGQINASYVDHSGSESLDIAYVTSLLSSIQLNQQAVELGLSQADVEALLTPPTVTTSSISFDDGEVVDDDDIDVAIKTGAAYFICIAIFMFIMTYSSIIAEEIASEKGTRIMEVILSSVSSTTHFFGKLTAIFLICMTQIVFYVIIGLIAFQFDIVQNLIPDGLDIVNMLSGIVGVSLFYFITGITLYAVIAAFLGSLVTKTEDVSKAVTPIVFIALAGFYGGLFAFATTTTPIVKIGSHIPLFTPFIMPFRIAAETVSTTEVVVSMVVIVAFTVFVTFISLLLYRSNVLIYSDSNMFKIIKTSIRNVRNERRNVHNN